MDGWKASGPDGFLGCFFQTFWNIVGPKLTGAIQKFQKSSFIPKAVNFTFIALIPKIVVANSFNKFRPINLCNFSYKVLAKSLVNRLKKVLPTIINQN